MENFPFINNVRLRRFAMISEEKLSKPIKINEFRSVVLEILNRYANSKETIEDLRKKKGLAKLVVDELNPLSLLIDLGDFDKSLFVQFYPERNTPYDADLIDVNGNLVERFEITMAINGHQESLRMEHLNLYGRAPGNDDIEFKGTKRNRNIKETCGIAKCASEIEEQLYAAVDSAYKKKCQKKEYTNISLLVGISSLCTLRGSFWSSLNGLFDKSKGPFDVIYVVDVYSNTYKQYKPNKKIKRGC